MADNSTSFSGVIPSHYDQGLGPVFFQDYAAETAARVARLKPRRVLETAAGTGIVTRRLRDALPAETSITATDLNPPMLELARAKFSADEAVTFQPADAQDLPFEDAAFDVMVCQYGIMFYPDKPKSFAEARRVLEPGGRYVFSVWASHAYNVFAGMTHELIVETFGADAPPFYTVPFSCGQIDPIRDMLSQAGFGEVDIAILPAMRKVADMDAFTRAMVYGNPLVEQVRARGADPDALVEAIRARLRGAFPDNVLPLQTILYSAQTPG